MATKQRKPWPLISALLCVAVLASSCIPKRYRAASTAMEPTIEHMETFWVMPADTIKRNDIVAFQRQDAVYGNVDWIHRVVGVPGDTIEVRDKLLFVNGQLHDIGTPLYYTYVVTVQHPIEATVLADCSCEPVDSPTQPLYFCYLTDSMYQVAMRSIEPLTIEPLVNTPGAINPMIYLADSTNNWNEDNFGPITLASPSNADAETFYFVMGDNRQNALDSRYIGPIARSSILGVASGYN